MKPLKHKKAKKVEVHGADNGVKSRDSKSTPFIVVSPLNDNNVVEDIWVHMISESNLSVRIVLNIWMKILTIKLTIGSCDIHGGWIYIIAKLLICAIFKSLKSYANKPVLLMLMNTLIYELIY